MLYSIKSKSGMTGYFSVYDYDYRDPDTKMQFDSDYPNIVALYKSNGGMYELINVLLLDSVKKFFIYELPTFELYDTNKVLVLGGSRYPSLQDTMLLLQEEFPIIERGLKNISPLRTFQEVTEKFQID